MLDESRPPGQSAFSTPCHFLPFLVFHGTTLALIFLLLEEPTGLGCMRCALDGKHLFQHGGAVVSLIQRGWTLYLRHYFKLPPGCSFLLKTAGNNYFGVIWKSELGRGSPTPENSTEGHHAPFPCHHPKLGDLLLLQQHFITFLFQDLSSQHGRHNSLLGPLRAFHED